MTVTEERRKPKQRLNEVLHILQKSRIFALAITYFICWLTYDFHSFFKANYENMQEWQLVSVLAYAGTQIACIKFIFEHIAKPIERDHD